MTPRTMASGEASSDMAPPVNPVDEGEIDDSVGEAVVAASFTLFSPGAAAAADAASWGDTAAGEAVLAAAASAEATFDAWTAAASVAEAMAATPA